MASARIPQIALLGIIPWLCACADAPGQADAADRGVSPRVVESGPEYQLEVLDNSDTFSQAIGIDAHGNLLGSREVADPSGTIFSEECFYVDARGTVALPKLPDFSNVVYQEISDTGRAVGYASRPVGHPEGSLRAVVWDRATGRITSLGALPGDVSSHAQSISADGKRIAGYSTGSEPARLRPCVWTFDDAAERWQAEPLSVLLDNNPYIVSSGVRISPDGTKVAACITVEELSPFIVDSSVFLWEWSGAAWERRALSDEQMYIHAMNDRGEMAGTIVDRGVPQPCHIDGSGAVTRIALLEGDVSGAAHGIDASGTVVGFSDDPQGPTGGPRAFTWKDGRTTPLPLPETTEFSSAFAINDRGQVAGLLDVELPDPDGGDEPLVKTLAFRWTPQAPEDRPNVVWIFGDDLGTELGCYGYPEVATPHVDRLAAEGIRFTHAFATAPVCSPSRTAIQTGRYQTTVGGHHHDTEAKPTLPSSTPTVTQLMRRAGYFVTNGSGLDPADTRIAKSHFNFVYDPQEYFDGADWSARAAGQPFFAQVQIKEPHRPFVTNVGPRPNAPIPPYYPEHPVTRADWDNYLASVEEFDRKERLILERLDREGIADRTIVVLFGDHGRPHVRDKQWLYDGGLHVPLIVRWPGKLAAGGVDERLVSLLDLMPTTLVAAGVAVPELPGADLLNTDWRGHERLFAARDRCGDALDRIRSVRTREFKYIRNFHPDRPYTQHSGYKKLQYPVETLMKVLHAQGDWDSPWMAPTRPSEELYDLEGDPHEMHNLAADPRHARRLAAMRDALDRWIVDTGDLGAIDEGETVDLEALRASKWQYYERGMIRRGLTPDISDQEYLRWWEQQLGLP